MNRFVLTCLLCVLPAAAHADSLLQRAAGAVSSRWAETGGERGKVDLYLPLYAWHNRSVYSPEERALLSERPLGLGVGRSALTPDGSSHYSFYALAFRDSEGDVQPIAGYLQTWRMQSGGLFAGLGYTAFVTARRHFHRYLPFPGVLPVAELGYGDFSLYATYIPGGRTDGRRYGNIAFVMGRYAF